MKYKNAAVYCIMLLITLILIFLMKSFDLLNNYAIEEKEILEDKKIVIKFVSSWGGADPKSYRLQELLNRFQKENPNTLIINESMSGEEFLYKLKTDFAQGNDPDVFGLWPGSDIKLLISKGKVADLSDILYEDMQWYNSFGKEAWSYDSINGKKYGLPCEIIYEGLFINNDLFEEYNVKKPQTYDELIEAVKKFRAAGIIPIAYNATAEGTYIYQNMVMKLGGKLETEYPYKNNEINQCFIEAMMYMKELYQLKAFPDNAFSLDDYSRNDLFLKKKAAMIVQGSWFIGRGSLNPDDTTVDIMPFPQFKEGKAEYNSVIYGIGNGNFHLSSAAFNNQQKKNICIKLLKFLTSPDAVKEYMSESGFISNVDIEEKAYTSSNLLIKGQNLINAAKETIGPVDSFLDRNIWRDILVKRFPEVLENRITPEELFKDMQLKMTGGK